MSTNYSFYCEPLKMKNGFFSRQAWGWGNFTIITCFKWLAYCIEKYGIESIKVISEYDIEYEEHWNTIKNNFKYFASIQLDFLIKTRDYYPRSNDYGKEGKPIDNEDWFNDAKEDLLNEVKINAPELLQEFLIKFEQSDIEHKERYKN